MPNKAKKPWYYDYKIVVPAVVAILVAAIGIIFEIWNNPFEPDFSLSVKPMEGSVQQGGIGQILVNVNDIHGYEYPISLSTQEQIDNLTISFNPKSKEIIPYTSIMTINVGRNVQTNKYGLTIRGIGADGKEHFCEYTLNIIPPVIQLPTEAFVVYNDLGIASGDIQIWSGEDFGLPPPILVNGDYQDPESPEGNECFRIEAGRGNQNYVGWGVFLGTFNNNHELTQPQTTDLTGYSSMEFYVKTTVNLKVEIQQDNDSGPKSYACYINNYGWNSDLANDWQRITIPINSFRNVNMSSIFCPFMITGNGNEVTFCVDNVRWIP